MKECKKCGQIKPLEEFHKKARSKDGRQSLCKVCFNAYRREYNKVHRDRVRAANEKWLKANPEARKAMAKRTYKKNIQRIKAYNKKYRDRNRERDRVKERDRRKNDPVFALKRKTSKSITRSIKDKGYTKKSTSSRVLGCSYPTFLEWLGGVPKEGQHLDHIVPISLAKTEDEVLLLNHYTNFQILDAEVNIKKGNSYIMEGNYNRVLGNHPHPEKIREIVTRSGIELKK